MCVRKGRTAEKQVLSVNRAHATSWLSTHVKGEHTSLTTMCATKKILFIIILFIQNVFYMMLGDRVNKKF